MHQSVTVRFTRRSIYVPPMTRLITINDVMPSGSVRLPLLFSPGGHAKALAALGHTRTLDHSKGV